MSKHGINVNLTSDKKPLKQQTVIVAGGLAMWDGEQWVSMMDGCRHKPITWSVSWWADLPNSVCPPKFCDERGWPLVPVDPQAIPEGYEAVRVGWAKGDEWTARSGNNQTYACFFQGGTDISCHSPFLIIRPIQKPIRLPLAIVPSGWWIRRNHRNKIFISKNQPELISTDWYTRGEVYEVPQPIAASLPKEWCELPWEQSLMQQTEGGEG